MIKWIFLLGLAATIAFSVIPTPEGSFSNHSSETLSPDNITVSQGVADLLPGGSIIPEALPSTISDPILQAGWVHLYNQQEPLISWNDEMLTGREIAEKVIEYGVSIQWNVTNECSGASCTERPVCRFDSSCPAVESNPDHIDIFIARRYQDSGILDIKKLAGTMAHEMIHYLMPFGGADDTLYEEFWAFRVGSQIAQNIDLDFEGYDSLKGSCLKVWFQSNLGNYYDFLSVYPPSVEAIADSSDGTCTITQKMPGETDGFPSGK